MKLNVGIHHWAAVDFETNYDKLKGLSVTEGTYPYLHHPDFEAYLVSVRAYVPGGVLAFDYVGHPKNFDWSQLDHFYLAAHNASFDEAVFDFIAESGIVADPKTPTDEDRDSRWYCTADLAAFLQCTRSLAGAVLGLYGVKVDKGMRNWMNGKTWADAVAAGKDKALMAYAGADTVWCARILLENVAKWPLFERRLSLMTRAMARHGVFVDQQALTEGLNTLSTVVFDAEQKLPWTAMIDPKTKDHYPPLSTPGLHNECAKHNIPPPESRAKDCEELEEWLNQYGKDYEFVSAMGTYQQANGHLQKLRTVKKRLQPNGRMAYGLKYYGADVTARWSGDSGFNTQNMPRKPKFGVDLRGVLSAAPGHSFVIADLSQIEPRCLAWLAKDNEYLDLIRQGYNPYEAHAIASGTWTPTGSKPLSEHNPELYSMTKVEVLGFGYGAGFEKVPGISQIYGAYHLLQKPVTMEMVNEFYTHLGKYSPTKLERIQNQTTEDITVLCNAWHKVQNYRQLKPRVPALWRKMDNAFKSVAAGENFAVRLPSGRDMIYYDVRAGIEAGESYTALTERAGNRKKFYGAMLVENLCQGMARDVFGHCLLMLENAGLRVVLQIHDEVVIECRTEDAPSVAGQVQQIMSTPPAYLPGFPLGCSVKIAPRYQK